MSQRIATDSSLMIRSNGERRFHRAYIAANGNPKPLFALVAGKPELRPDGIYYLRYRERDGTRRYEYIGKDPQLARLMQVQRQHLIVGEEMGLPTVEGAKVPRPVKIVPVEIPSVVPLIHPRLPGRHNQQVRSGGRCTPQTENTLASTVFVWASSSRL